jgi:hypothetical protein
MRMNKPCSQHAQSIPVTAPKPQSLRTLASASELILDAGLFITLPVLVAEPVLGAGGAAGAGAAAGLVSTAPIFTQNTESRKRNGEIFMN